MDLMILVHFSKIEQKSCFYLLVDRQKPSKERKIQMLFPMLLKTTGLKDDLYLNEEESRFRGGIPVCIHAPSSHTNYQHQYETNGHDGSCTDSFFLIWPMRASFACCACCAYCVGCCACCAYCAYCAYCVVLTLFGQLQDNQWIPQFFSIKSKIL